jgi:sugar/nucleoside kinase (ribokinase family)
MHVSGYSLLREGSQPATLAALDQARRTGMTISVDGASAAPLDRLGAEPYLDLTNGATLLFVNEAQATVLTGREDAAQAARVLTAWYPEVVVKRGPEGALYADGRSDPVFVPAQSLEESLDGTGGGDAFCAGFLSSWLDKKPPAEALAGGCRLAGRARSLVGARPVL